MNKDVIKNSAFKFKKPKTLQDSILEFPKGESVLIKIKYVKPSSVRSAVRELREKGYNIECTDKGIYDGIRVTLH